MFHMLIGHFYISGELSLFFYPFYNWVDFFVVDFSEFSNIYRYESFIRYVICRYFLPFSGLLFHVVDSILCSF